MRGSGMRCVLVVCAAVHVARAEPLPTSLELAPDRLPIAPDLSLHVPVGLAPDHTVTWRGMTLAITVAPIATCARTPAAVLGDAIRGFELGRAWRVAPLAVEAPFVGAAMRGVAPVAPGRW